MTIGTFSYPIPVNEPTLQYGPGSPEKAALKKTLSELKHKPVDIPMYIGGEEVVTDRKIAINPPYEKDFLLGYFSEGEEKHVEQAIDAALAAKESWEAMSWENRAHIFLKAADLLSTKYRYHIVATTMLGQGKNVYQAEIDAACELIDFLRFNVHFLGEIYKQQPISSPGMNNRVEWRPLEGFVLAVSPFNFTAIGGNLCASAALCGNVVVWKPAYTQIYSANIFMQVLKEAGLPDGVINLIYVDGPALGKVCFSHPQFAGVHFTGSTGVFNTMWKSIGENISKYRSYPRIVGETIKMGSPEDFSNFVNAVIDERAFDKISNYIANAKSDSTVKIISGGNYDKIVGYFIEPTVIETTDPKYKTMCEEIFGPVLTIYVYDEEAFEETLKLVDTTSPYALTGAIIAQDRAAVELATNKLRNSAGNFYVNDKPTGAVVGQQPFGGARGSGTNDKAGSIINLYRWLSARTIKEVYVPVTDYSYPFVKEA